MRYWENGVADDMQMDFGDFSMDARMTEFKAAAGEVPLSLPG